jgi:hypothetical protein
MDGKSGIYETHRRRFRIVGVENYDGILVSENFVKLFCGLAVITIMSIFTSIFQ